MKSSLPLLTGLIILSQSILSVSAAVPTSPPSSSAAPAGGYFSQYFSNIANGSFALANNIGGSTASVCGTNGIIVGFNTTPGNSFLSPQCKNLSTLLPSLVGTILTSTTGTADQAVTGFTSTGAPIYGNVSSSDAPVGAIMPFMLTSCPAGWIAADGTNGTVDLRGEFVRGLDSGRGVDAARTLGSWQVDIFKSHSHTIQGYHLGALGTGNLPWYNWANPGNMGYKNINTVSLEGGTETRPRNVALLYCQKLTSNSTPSSNVTWTNTTGTNAGNVVQATTGNVGIGTINPTAKLEVNGNIKVGDSGAGCNTGNEGQMKYNSTTKTMEFCNGMTWTSISGGGGGGLGYGQTWQPMIGSRLSGTTYTNNTGKPIMVNIVTNDSTAITDFNAYVSGVRVGGGLTTAYNVTGTVSFIVPDGASYYVTGGSISSWAELR